MAIAERSRRGVLVGGSCSGSPVRGSVSEQRPRPDTANPARGLGPPVPAAPPASMPAPNRTTRILPLARTTAWLLREGDELVFRRAALHAALAGTLVEFLDALTIVLAVATTRGRRGAPGGTGLAIAVLLLLLLLLMVGLGDAIAWIPLQPLQVALGALTLLFGMRWLRKAMLRATGAIPLRDELAAYGRQGAASAASGPRDRWDRDAPGTTFA